MVFSSTSFAKDTDSLDNTRDLQVNFHTEFTLERVINGFVIVADGLKIRLWGIDVPVQFHRPAKIFLQSLTAKGKLTCKFIEKDSYGRHVMHCLIDGLDIGSMMVNVGLARDYTKYSGDYYQYEEDLAKAKKRGIWSEEKEINRSFSSHTIPEAIALKIGKEGYKSISKIKASLKKEYKTYKNSEKFSWGDLDIDVGEFVIRYRDLEINSFNAMDKNHDGVLTPEEAVPDVFELLDINMDGFVTREEKLIKGEEKAFRNIGWHYKRMFALDMDSDGFVTLDEHLYYFEKAFPIVDLNNDKWISQEERDLVFKDYKLREDLSLDIPYIPYDFDLLKEKLNYTDSR